MRSTNWIVPTCVLTIVVVALVCMGWAMWKDVKVDCCGNFYKEEVMGQIQLGEVVKCKITGFKGTVVGMTEWQNGCRRLGVRSPNLDKDGKLLPLEWFDEGDVDLVSLTKEEKAKLKGECCKDVKEEKEDGPGGPPAGGVETG